MFSKDEAKQLRQEFWTAFGKACSNKRSEGGYRVNWGNYRTGAKGVSFRMWATPKKCGLGIELDHPVLDIRELHWAQLLELKMALESEVGALIWEDVHTRENGKVVCLVYTERDDFNIYNKSTWPNAIPFLKEKIFALDRFWTDFSELFTILQ